ncbi:MAG: hypothetical protein KDD51_01195 [Bdellovibrionales bacterium]|nr:hypothetical protein [Bdellovibrionales bacterium]
MRKRFIFSLLVVSGFVFLSETSVAENVVSLRNRSAVSGNSHAGVAQSATSRPVVNANEFIPFTNPYGQNPISPTGLNYPSGIGSFNPSVTPYNTSFSPWGYSNNSLYNPIYGGGLYNPIYGGGYGYGSYPGVGYGYGYGSYPSLGYGYGSYPGLGYGYGYGSYPGYGYGYGSIDPWYGGASLWQDPYLYSGSTYGLYGSGYGSYGLGGFYGTGYSDPYSYGGYGYGNYGLSNWGYGYGDGSGYGFGSGPWGSFSFNW